jgi:hypothetical protein
MKKTGLLLSLVLAACVLAACSRPADLLDAGATPAPAAVALA